MAVLVFICCGVLPIGRVPRAGAQGSTAVVTGAEHVFIRRGPGTEFPPFANLSEGTKVEIQEMRGEWARVLTASGQSGYVRSTFLAPATEPRTGAGESAPPATARPGAASVSARPAAASPTRRSASPAPTEVAPTPGPTLQRGAEVPTSAQGGLEAVPSPAAPSATDLDTLHADIVRLNASVEQLQRRLDVDAPRANPLPLAVVPGAGEGGAAISTGILVGAVGLCIGWLLGTAYGRRQERSRRPRVRL